MTAATFASEFPLLGDAVYLNHAASSPLPRRSAEALARHVDERQRIAPLYQTGRQDYDVAPLRAKLARLLGTRPEAVAFLPSTTDGIAAALNGIDWRAGDNVIVPANDFPGVVYPCLGLARRGVEIRRVPVPDHLDLGALLAALDARSRAVAVSHVHWQSGHRIDLARLGEACRRRGVLTIVDAMQSAGAVPVDFDGCGIDVLATGSYKWLLGIAGVAVLCVGRAALETLVPDRAGWMGVRTSVHAAPALDWRPDAGRFAVGGHPDPALIALEPSIDLLLSCTVEWVAETTAALLDRAVAGLRAIGLRVWSDLEPCHRSSFVSVTTGEADRNAHLARALLAQGLVVACRGRGLRIAPHAHNTSAQIDRFVEATRAASRG